MLFLGLHYWTAKISSSLIAKLMRPSCTCPASLIIQQPRSLCTTIYVPLRTGSLPISLSLIPTKCSQVVPAFGSFTDYAFPSATTRGVTFDQLLSLVSYITTTSSLNPVSSSWQMAWRVKSLLFFRDTKANYTLHVCSMLIMISYHYKHDNAQKKLCERYDYDYAWPHGKDRSAGVEKSIITLQHIVVVVN